MPLNGIPISFTPELLYALAKMGHGDKIVIADANFPGDKYAAHTTIKSVIRVSGTTSSLLKDVLSLLPLDQEEESGVIVMERTPADKEVQVPAYSALAVVAGVGIDDLVYKDRQDFYETAKDAFCIVQTDDSALYSNVIVSKGLLKKNSRSKRKCWVVKATPAPASN